MSQHPLADPRPVSAPPYAPSPTSPYRRPPAQDAPHSEQAPPSRSGGRRGRRRAPKRTPLLGDYLGYAATFVGAGLISGAIVHHPLDPTRYTFIAVVGAAVFLCATVLNEFVLTRSRPSAGKVCGVVAASLTLSFGIGMLSGGLQHFEDFPERAAMLIPFGLALSFASYVLRHQPARWRSILGPAGILVAVTAALAFVGLKGIAQEIATQPGGDGHGHSHGDEPAAPAEPGEADGHEHESGPTQAPADGPSRTPEPTATTPSSPAAEDHGEAGHSH
ncbi:hypothetical protein EJ357_41370 [Streptomyces cyaneochromogenes]|uniref:Uncharacterized protein n=1 Tax=Streptomyces cyaneochromogenes TaxID=2496836 RepID=A0A3Q9EZ87_9ACTN|nr:hypothetical protein [Streptomyces cyaneochromogenes]AZQ39093.1 hypothetical protein EJ357_41370 [Streptomyces cyaneochromogenes]